MSRFVSIALVGATMLLAGNTFAAGKYNAAAGKATYDASCATCHKAGLMGAPKLGDKAAWAPRLSQGIDAMVAKSVKGFKGAKGTMPPKGGNNSLTPAQVGNAVAYMVGASK